MKAQPFRRLLTIGFLLGLLLVGASTYGVFYYATGRILEKNVRDRLIETVQSNVHDIRFMESVDWARVDASDVYLPLDNGFLEVDGGFQDSLQGMTVALYDQDHNLLYGTDPYASPQQLPFVETQLHTWSPDTGTVFVFDRALTVDGTDNLWLRGIVPRQEATAPLRSILLLSLVLLPVVLALSLALGYLFAKRWAEPITALTKRSAEITDGHDLKGRIDKTRGPAEVVALTDTYNRMMERLDASFTAQNQFLSDASHELRTPLAVMKAQTEWMLSKNPTTDEYKKAMEVLDRQQQKMTGMVDALLQFSRFEQHKEQYSKDMLDFSRVVESIADDHALLDANTAMHLQIDPGITLYGNAELLEILVTNLLQNAYRYGKSGGNVWVILEKDTASVRLAVKDDGIGIAEADLTRIFDRFYQSDSSRSQSGTGLGLSFVREIAQWHDATVNVQSTLGEGSVFEVIFKHDTL